MFDSSILYLKLTQYPQGLNEFVAKPRTIFKDTQGFGSCFQCAQTSFSGLRSNNIIANSSGDQFDLLHFVQQRAARIDCLRLWPRTINEKQIVWPLAEVHLFQWNRRFARIQ